MKRIRVILVNELDFKSEGEVCAVATSLSVGRSSSLVWTGLAFCHQFSCFGNELKCRYRRPSAFDVALAAKTLFPRRIQVSGIFAEEFGMKKLRRFDPGQEGIRVGDVWINAKYRDDIPKLLGGLRDVYLNVELRDAVFRLLEERIGVTAIGMLSVRGVPVDDFRTWRAEAETWLRLRPAS